MRQKKIRKNEERKPNSTEVKTKQTNNNKVALLFVSFLPFLFLFVFPWVSWFFCAFCQKHENRLPVRNGKYSCSMSECAWVSVGVSVRNRTASNVWLIGGRKLIVFSKQTLHKRMWIYIWTEKHSNYVYVCGCECECQCECSPSRCLWM